MQNNENKSDVQKQNLKQDDSFQSPLQKSTTKNDVSKNVDHQDSNDSPSLEKKSPDNSPDQIKVAKTESVVKEREELERKNQEVDKTLQKLVIQNEKLSKEVSEIREQIMTAMEKSKMKNKRSKSGKEDPEIKELKAKIETQAKEILSFQKELAVLQEKTDGKKTKERITDLENSLKFKEAELEKLNRDKKTLEEIRKSHQNMIESIKTEKDYNKKVSIYQDEIRKLKDEIRDQQKKEMEYEKEQRKQHEYLAVLEQRYREACKKTGVSASLNFTRAEKQNEETKKLATEKLSLSDSKIKLEAKNKQPTDPKNNQTTDAKNKDPKPTEKVSKPTDKEIDPKNVQEKDNKPDEKKEIKKKDGTQEEIKKKETISEDKKKDNNKPTDKQVTQKDEKKKADDNKTAVQDPTKKPAGKEPKQQTLTKFDPQKSTTNLKGNNKENKGAKSEKSLLKIKENDPDDDKLPKEVNEQNYKILLAKYQEVQNQRQSNLKKYKQQEDTYVVKVKELELEKRVLSNKLKEKETEANIAIAKLNELKRLAKSTSLSTPLEVLDKSFLKNAIEYNTKKSLLKQILDTRRRKTKREVIGDTSSDPADIVFLDDCELLGDYLTMDFRIVEISVYHDGKNKIYGFKAVYLIDGEKVEGHNNVLKQVKSLPTTKVAVLKMDKTNDSLKFISGFHLEFIEYIKFESLKGDSIAVGSLSGEKARDLKEFCIDVKKDEMATVLFGGLKFNSSSNNTNDMLLSYFGMETLNNNIYQKWLNKKKAMKDEIEESIFVDEENSILQRRGLVLGKKVPMKKY